MPGDEFVDDPVLYGGARREPVAVFGLGHGIHHALSVGERDPDFDAVCGSDISLCLNVFPGCVEAFGADE